MEDASGEKGHFVATSLNLIPSMVAARPLFPSSILVKSSRALYYLEKKMERLDVDAWKMMLELAVRWKAAPRLKILWLFVLDLLKWNIRRSSSIVAAGNANFSVRHYCQVLG